MQKHEAMEFLGLSGKPSAQQVIEAYHRLAKKYHPDLYATHDETIQQVMQEKFVQLGKAKDALLDEMGAKDSSAGAEGQGLEHDLINIESRISHRQFSDALELLEKAISMYGDLPLLYEIRFQVHSEMERFQDAFSDLRKLESLAPELANDPDYLHTKSITAAQSNSFTDAHAAVDAAMEKSDRPCPLYMATKASIYIMQGETHKADTIIETLSKHDPTHPLVQQRSQVMNVGGHYVGKQESAKGACILCVILECIFDFI